MYLEHRLVVVLRDHLLEVLAGTRGPFQALGERLKRIPRVMFALRLMDLALGATSVRFGIEEGIRRHSWYAGRLQHYCRR